MGLHVVLRAGFLDEFDLGFESVDLFFGFVQNQQQPDARHIFGVLLTGDNTFLDGFLRAGFQLQVALQNLARVLAVHYLEHQLHVGQAVQHQDALVELVGMLHFADRLLVFLLAEFFQSPVPVHARMQEILVDRGEFIGQLRIQQLDDSFIALHGGLRSGVEKRLGWQQGWLMPGAA